jgi:hypothetical protein
MSGVGKRFSKKALKRFVETIAVVILGSCLTPLDRYSDYLGGQLVISGQIGPIPETNSVIVARTSSTERLPEPVSAAVVLLYDESGEIGQYTEDPLRAGRYNLENLNGLAGKTYHIRVTTPDGENYESLPETIPSAIGADSVSYTFEKESYTDFEGIVAERDFIKVYTTASLPAVAGPVYIKWHVHEDYLLSPTDFPDPFGTIPPPCFISQQVDPQRIVLFNGAEVRAETVADLLIGSRLLDKSFKERHYFTIYQTSLSANAFEYWRKIENVANQIGSIFDPPPARVKGNMSNVDRTEEVLGYFQAVNQTYQRFFLLPSDLPAPLNEYCQYRSNRDYRSYPGECLNCLIAPNSSYSRPPWF